MFRTDDPSAPVHYARGVTCDPNNVPPGLRRGYISLFARAMSETSTAISESEARAAGYSESEIASFFGRH